MMDGNGRVDVEVKERRYSGVESEGKGKEESGSEWWKRSRERKKENSGTGTALILRLKLIHSASSRHTNPISMPGPSPLSGILRTSSQRNVRISAAEYARAWYASSAGVPRAAPVPSSPPCSCLLLEPSYEVLVEASGAGARRQARPPSSASVPTLEQSPGSAIPRARSCVRARIQGSAIGARGHVSMMSVSLWRKWAVYRGLLARERSKMSGGTRE
ncbi:hypothetical protein B0H13DRAFT_1891959 [Mycena leptocephala]|nr:hypothetical protein B0H13DRAFT_1891959 [Mycena leptocephala]